MWKKVIIGGSEFLLKHSVFGTLHKIYLTNFIHLWFEDIEEEMLLCRCKEMNKLLEASDDVFLGHVWSLVESEDGSEADIVRVLSDVDTDTTRSLTLQTSLDGFKFRIKFLLAPANPFQFYEEITQLLLTTVSELEHRQQVLVDLVKSKDVEIQEYKLEGGQISRKAVETVPFDTEVFSAKCHEHVSVSKSRVAAHPSHTFTAPVQHLLDEIVVAPLITNETNLDEPKKNKIKKLEMRVKSPSKNKKKKIYEDDDDNDVGDEDESGGDVKVNVQNQLKVVQEIHETKRQSSGKPKLNGKLKRALHNL